MTPSVFSCAAGKRASELDIATGWGSTENARSVLEHHWDTWITKSDFAYLASIGINTVRLPIGYWSLGPDFMYGTDFAGVADVYRGSWWRVKRAISWAAENGIGVLIDLHGAIGSQNGQTHSGVSTGKNGLFTSEDNMSKTINVLTYLAQQLESITNVVGLQLLNEPDNVDGLPAFC
jgi:glucan 1,3-beta-glucosidase